MENLQSELYQFCVKFVMLNKVIRLFNTIKYLKFKQISWRAINLFPRFIKYVSNPPIILDNIHIERFIAKNSSTNDFKNFTFLNETYNLKSIGWDNSNLSKLWLYNLHYFNYIIQSEYSDLQKSKQLDLIENWIDCNPFGKGTGWEPYPTSLRIINWIKWHWSTRSLSNKAIISLWNQILWLNKRPEFHLLGNHLFINAKALLFATVFFKQNETSSIFKTASSIISNELNEQFLSDGSQFELSPMYHSLAMEDLLDILTIANYLPNSFPVLEFKDKYYKGMLWLDTMKYKNDELSHFNDCSNGIAPTYKELDEFASIIGLSHLDKINGKLFYHQKSGYIVYRDNNSHLIADVGNVGPDYLPGHSHADTLSFELAVRNHRIIVNSGTSVYGISQERLRQRGTQAHSTIEIDNTNSTEVWSGFRVARRARPFDVKVNYNKLENETNFIASHNGYSRLKGNPIHTRLWKFNGKEWQIKDSISGNNNIITSRYYLHPEIQIRKNNIGFVLSKNNFDLVFFKTNLLNDCKIIDTSYHDEFGIVKSNKCIQIITTSPCSIITNLILY
jgi:uncharacterized heparinase superfamily protein